MSTVYEVSTVHEVWSAGFSFVQMLREREDVWAREQIGGGQVFTVGWDFS
ncbi:MAG: hypothetical protein JO033_10395 [Acidobacteriaceae bacterium]|nr:hypothetical protein [Acidobacteriaceae bacterium]MBV9501889.1 hypothetical protein [Acidobacteriaceae bacterium]